MSVRSLPAWKVRTTVVVRRMTVVVRNSFSGVLQSKRTTAKECHAAGVDGVHRFHAGQEESPMSKTIRPPALKRFFTREEAAEYLAVSPSTLSRWAAERTGPPFVKLGDHEKSGVRYPREGLEEFCASRLRNPK
jgi:excisionase family DNA binding protein